MGQPPVALTFSSTLMYYFFLLSGKEYKSSFRTPEDGCALKVPRELKHKHGRVRNLEACPSIPYL